MKRTLRAGGHLPKSPVKVINYLLAAYIDPAIGLKQLQET